jgi:hypothetical protein
MQVRQTLTLLFTLALVGCMKPNPLIYTLGEDSTGSETGDGDAGDGDSGETQAPIDMPDGELCEPFEPFELGCGECVALGCCEVALACAGVDECLCLADCMLGGASAGSCKQGCAGAKADSIDELQPLLDCASSTCEQEC